MFFEELKLRSLAQGMCKYWHLVFESGSWATFTINEYTGEFSVESDWGNYAHRWHTDHIGEPDMEHFIVRCSAEYILRKFAYDEPVEFGNEFNEEKTKKVFFARIIERRLSGFITKQEARRCWEEIEELFETLDSYNPVISVYENFPEIVTDLCNISYLCEEWFCYGPSDKYLFLEHQLIPFFQNHLRKSLEKENCTSALEMG